jgi:hypothetical protein
VRGAAYPQIFVSRLEKQPIGVYIPTRMSVTSKQQINRAYTLNNENIASQSPAMRQTSLTTDFRHPLANLRPNYTQAEPEAKFTAAFARAYLDKAHKIHAGSARTNLRVTTELPVNGYGIADLVAVFWKNEHEIPHYAASLPSAHDGKFTIRVFESKLGDWKKGLMQAHRYSYFADAAFLVYPMEKVEKLRDKIDTFHKLGVGLWGFDEKTGSILPIYTPRPRKPRVPKHREPALERVLLSSISPQPV